MNGPCSKWYKMGCASELTHPILFQIVTKWRAHRLTQEALCLLEVPRIKMEVRNLAQDCCLRTNNLFY